jgi:hypothetical protein
MNNKAKKLEVLNKVRNIASIRKTIRVDKVVDSDNRKVIKLYDVTSQRELIGSYVDGQLMNIYVMNTLLAYIENGFNVKINDQWPKENY